MSAGMASVGSRGRYFAGDLAACVAAGAAVAFLTGAIVPQGWPGWAAMPLGMLLGMLLSLPIWLLASSFLGMLEPMLQIMLAGMLAGMAAVMEPDSAIPLPALGAACGAGAALALGALDLLLRRRSSQWQ